jgi:hypothetical protein
MWKERVLFPLSDLWLDLRAEELPQRAPEFVMLAAKNPPSIAQRFQRFL